MCSELNTYIVFFNYLYTSVLLYIYTYHFFLRAELCFNRQFLEFDCTGLIIYKFNNYNLTKYHQVDLVLIKIKIIFNFNWNLIFQLIDNRISDSFFTFILDFDNYWECITFCRHNFFVSLFGRKRISGFYGEKKNYLVFVSNASNSCPFVRLRNNCHTTA